MRDYNRTLWENNKTVVDAESLNNVEDQLQVLTVNSVDNNSRIAEIEITLPMKANINHSHEEYSLKEHTHNDFTTNEEFGKIKGDVEALIAEFNKLKEELGSEFKKYFDDAAVEEDMLHLYSHGVLLKSLKLPKGQGPALASICGEFLSGDLNCGDGTEYSLDRTYDPTLWQDGVTPVNAHNLNKIENKLVELTDKIVQIEQEGVDIGGLLIHVGPTAPTSTTALWIDNTDEDADEVIDNTILDSIASVLQDHKEKFAELFFLTDAYLDDGEFTDTAEPENIIDGGAF